MMMCCCGGGSGHNFSFLIFALFLFFIAVVHGDVIGGCGGGEWPYQTGAVIDSLNMPFDSIAGLHRLNPIAH